MKPPSPCPAEFLATEPLGQLDVENSKECQAAAGSGKLVLNGDAHGRFRDTLFWLQKIAEGSQTKHLSASIVAQPQRRYV